jgi:hypothetical protein
VRRIQADPRKLRRLAEVGDLDVPHPMPPDVPGQLPQRRDSALSQMSVPLRPKRRLVLCEIEGIDDRATLPAVVARRVRASARIRTVRDLTQPPAGGRDGVDVERQVSPT